MTTSADAATAGAFHSLNYSKCAENYLAAFAYRAYRRFNWRSLVARLIADVSKTESADKPLSRRMLRHVSGQVCGSPIRIL